MMAKFSKKVMGKEVGSADVYAEPHDMQGHAGVDITNEGYDGGKRLKADEIKMSVNDVSTKDYAPVKTSGIKIRGTGAATKGTMARGPMV